jgi:hypothetical protein
MKKLITILLMMSSTCYAQQEFEGNFIEATASGGVPPYTYSIDSGAYQVSDIFFEVEPGRHTIRTKDSLGCVKTSTCMLYSDVSMKISVWNGTKYVPWEQYVPSPNRFLSIQLEGIGGKSPYYFSRNSTTKYIKNKIYWNGLSRGVRYTFRVKDSLGYIYFINITL